MNPQKMPLAAFFRDHVGGVLGLFLAVLKVCPAGGCFLAFK
jgi:hypothetical protein